jgi:L-alanine-DL-glutamate epimerase-like enolase superfamily enzyme
MVPSATDMRVRGAALYFLPVETRVPLKFGAETLTTVTCARARVRVSDASGRVADGWGETPLSVQWVWPGTLPYERRHAALRAFTERLAMAWADCDACGHPMEIGHTFIEEILPAQRERFNAGRPVEEAMPWLAALVCGSVFDLALHDAYGRLLGRPTYSTYTAEFMNADLGAFLEADAADVSFASRYPADFLMPQRADRLIAWHLVGGLDPVGPEDLRGDEPDDGYPVLLADWIRRDGLQALKVKLRGDDAEWDFARMVCVGRIALEHDVRWLSSDFNCTVRDPAYVNDVLDRLARDEPEIYARLLYVEQPFPYELEAHRIDVRSVSARRPLFLDESAHDWRLVRLGRQLGWTGVALKTCKTQTGAILSACWARAHGMSLMVQDLTNPMLAMVPHAQLAAHVGTIAGVETNAPQFYPAASTAETRVHPGLYVRRDGRIDLASVAGPGLGYAGAETARELPAPVVSCGEI